MFRISILKRLTPLVLAGVFVTASQSVTAQGVLDRLKRAAEEAAKKAEDSRKAADAKKAAEEAARREKEKTTPATPGGGNPNANSPNAATPARPGGGAAPSNVPGSSAKVEELSLASGQKLDFVVSPKGGHAAAVVLRGSRTVVVHDGVDGPRFDAISGESAGLVFSPDGSRLAYIGRQGAEFVFMADGKELLRVPAVRHPRLGSTSLESIPQFTDNSRHVYFPLYTEPVPGITNGYIQLVFDGVPGPQSFTNIAPIFTAGGDHHVYLAENPQKRGTFTLVVDGKPSPFPGGEPQMTADGLHVFTKRQLPTATPTTEVFLDGKPIMRAQSAQIYTTPVGSGFMTVVTQGTPGTGIHFLTMGAQRIPGTDCPWNPGYSNVGFSADGKHWVAACQASSSSFWIVADGKKGQDYQGIVAAGFTADGRFVYGANMRNQTFLVVGDQESEGYGSMLTPIDTSAPGYKPLLINTPLPPPAALVGNHIAFTALTNGTMQTVGVDGKLLQREGASPVTFSSDGTHFGFTFGRQGRTVNVDGKDLPGTVVRFQQPGVGRYRPRAEFVFSTDGKHVAYFDQQPGNASGVYVDGRLAMVFPGTNPQNLTFTPDGRHLIWMANIASSQTVYVDGRPSAQFDGNYTLQAAAGTWEMGADGTLTVVAQAGDAIKRFRITPGSDTSVDTIGK
ncbi:MAG TPA: hypothetical protein VFD21_12425 [Vicinamibacterales bacterium]|nr:hypothetical protein [Vicinamibacterales bacterium]